MLDKLIDRIVDRVVAKIDERTAARNAEMVRQLNAENQRLTRIIEQRSRQMQDVHVKVDPRGLARVVADGEKRIRREGH